MKKFLAILLITVALGLTFHASLAQSFNETKEREAIKLNIMGYEDGWNQHDAKAIAKLYHTGRYLGLIGLANTKKVGILLRCIFRKFTVHTIRLLMLTQFRLKI
jgi:hypothetical protein